MRCLHPVTIETDVVTPHSEGQKVRRKIQVPCGKCVACLSRRKDEWVFRLKKEFYNSARSVWVTLTYNELSVPISKEGKRTIRMDDISKFMKRFRKYEGNGVRFFACGEYGGDTNRPHYHIMLFNVSENYERNIIAAWPYGFPDIRPLTEGRIVYTCKYVLSSSQFVDDTPFTLGSRGLDARNLLSVAVDAQPSAINFLLLRL